MYNRIRETAIKEEAKLHINNKEELISQVLFLYISNKVLEKATIMMIKDIIINNTQIREVEGAIIIKNISHQAWYQPHQEQ